jgi:SAM-dependent methyltransferase
LHFDQLDNLADKSFDFVHSFIVFQHIPVREGEQIFRKLGRLLDVGGIGAIHVTYADKRSALRRAVLAIRKRSTLAHYFFNCLQGRSLTNPLMQMNSYSLPHLFDILIDEGCSNLHVDFSDHGGFRGAMLYFEKRDRALL